MSLQRVCRLSLVLGVASAIAIVMTHLALQDIYHQESDVTLEWQVVRVSFVIIIAFHVLALAAVWKVLRVVDLDSTKHPEAG